MSRVPPLPAPAWPRSSSLCLAPLQPEEGKVVTVRSVLASPGCHHRCCSAPAVRAARSSHKFWGSPSRLFFNCPQVGSWRLLRTLPSPRPLPLPHHTPTLRRRHATGRSLSWAIAAQPLSSGGRAWLGAAEPSGCLEHPTGVAGSCSDCAAFAAGLKRTVPRGQGETLALTVASRLQQPELIQALKSGGRWRKVYNRGTCPTTKALESWSPRDGEKQLLFPRRVQGFFLTLGELPSGTEGQGEV